MRANRATNAYSPARQAEILRAYHERTARRGLTRSLGVSRNSVTAWLKKVRQLSRLEQTLASAQARSADVGCSLVLCRLTEL